MLEGARFRFSNLGVERAVSYQRQLTALGAGYHIISDGGINPHLEKVLALTLLGKRANWQPLDEQSFLPHELSFEDPSQCRILTVIDYDGVFVSPVHQLIDNARKYLGHRISETETDAFQFLDTITAVSDISVLSTSRRCQPSKKVPSFFSQRFPFMSNTVVEKLKAYSNGRLAVELGKSMRGSSRRLQELVDTHAPDLVYIIGSSDNDRAAAINFLDSEPHYRDKLVFMDTGHLVV